MNDNVLLTLDDLGVATVTLNCPDKHNAFDDAMIAQLTDTFHKVSHSNARVMVLASNGKNFSAGADLSWMKRMATYSYEDNLTDAKALAEMLKVLNTLAIPTIARVQGAAFGGAVGLVSCCDMAIATEQASFCLSEVKIGLIPATISPYVISAIGQRACRRYFTTAERFSAETAAQLGLVSEVVPASELDNQLEAFVQGLLANGPTAIKAAKSLIEDFANQPIDDALINDSCERIAQIRVSTEGQEGLSAFLDKRPANWIKE